MAEETKSWWQTLPGILTAVAGLITAVTGFLLAMNQSGCFGKETKATEVHATTGVQPGDSNKPASSVPASVNGQKSAVVQTPVTAPTDSGTTAAPAAGKDDEDNLLSPDNGGTLVAAASDKWKETIDGSEDWVQLDYGIGQSSVYGFKDGKTATFHSFAMLITGTRDDNIKAFELFAGNESPTGKFTSLGKFTTTNIQLAATPYQLFSFPSVTAKYLKVKLISTWGWVHPAAYEFQLWGKVSG